VPRSYSMGRRTQAVTATRQRILDAALALYQEQGIAAATMQDVARRADVAPGTVANHFRTAAARAAEPGHRLL
jgi:AcrR family transcriptional regulator